MNDYFINIKKPSLDLIKKGKKRIELRINKGIFREIKKGDTLWFSHYSDLSDNTEKKVIKISKYNNFRECLEDNIESLKMINPLSESIEESIDIYLKPNGIYTKHQESLYGVVAIFIN